MPEVRDYEMLQMNDGGTVRIWYDGKIDVLNRSHMTVGFENVHKYYAQPSRAEAPRSLPAGWLEQWDIFTQDYNRYVSGDQKMPFSLFRDSLAAFVAETQDMIGFTSPQEGK